MFIWSYLYNRIANNIYVLLVKKCLPRSNTRTILFKASNLKNLHKKILKMLLTSFIIDFNIYTHLEEFKLYFYKKKFHGVAIYFFCFKFKISSMFIN